jgi:IS5 family transposase
MITNFDDFCLWMLVLVDDACQQLAPWFHRPGPRPTTCTDSELITMALLAECRSIDKETELLPWWHERHMRALFPRVPSRSRFNRRRRALGQQINLIRCLVLRTLDLAGDGQCVIDSLPIPVMGFHLVPGGSRAWAAAGARYGRCASKKQTLYGYKLHCVMTLGGVILDFVLAPANVDDKTAGEDLLWELHNRLVVGDKGYISAELAAELAGQGVTLVTVPRRNQKQHVSAAGRRLINGVRQIVETVNGQLVEQFHIETNHAYSFEGLCARLYTKLTAHTLSIKINRLLGNPDFLQIKQLAWPN